MEVKQVSRRNAGTEVWEGWLLRSANSIEHNATL